MRLSILVVATALLLSSAPAPAADQPLPELLQALQSQDESVRTRAIDALADRAEATPVVIAGLAGQLKNSSPLVRAHAAHALGRFGAAARPAVRALAPLVVDKDVKVQREVIRALVKIRPGPKVAGPLMRKVLDDADPTVRLSALHQLAELGKAAVPGLIDAVKDENGGLYACIVLAEIGPDAAEAIPALTDKVKSEKRPEVRREAIHALGAIGPAAAPAVPAIVEALADPEKAVALTAAFALGRIGPAAKEAQDALAKSLRSADPVLPVVSVWALSRIKPDDKQLKDQAATILVKAITGKDRQARRAAFQALAEVKPGPQRMLAAIQQALKGADKETVREALRALAELGEPAVPALIDALKLTEHRARVAAILGHIGPAAKKAVPDLIEVAKTDKRAVVRSEALMALGAIGADAAAVAPVAMAALCDCDEKVCLAACYALGELGPGAAVAEAELAKKLEAADPLVPLAAAWALVKIHPDNAATAPRVVPLLVRGLDNAEPMFREGAASALGTMGPLAKEALPALKKRLAEDKNPAVRKAAGDAIKAIQR